MWQQCITTIAADFPVRKILANGKRSRFLTNLVPNLTQLTVIQERCNTFKTNDETIKKNLVQNNN